MELHIFPNTHPNWEKSKELVVSLHQTLCADGSSGKGHRRLKKPGVGKHYMTGMLESPETVSVIFIVTEENKTPFDQHGKFVQSFALVREKVYSATLEIVCSSKKAYWLIGKISDYLKYRNETEGTQFKWLRLFALYHRVFYFREINGFVISHHGDKEDDAVVDTVRTLKDELQTLEKKNVADIDTVAKAHGSAVFREFILLLIKQFDLGEYCIAPEMLAKMTDEAILNTVQTIAMVKRI